MKYLITESQIDRIILRYLDIQGFKKVQSSKTLHVTTKIIFFTTNPDSRTSDISYWGGTHKKLYITAELCSNIMSMFSLEELYDCLSPIKQWVENEIGKTINIEDVHVYGKESVLGDITFKIPEE